MPTYEYQCRRCGYHFEEFQSIVSEPLKVCPKCKGELTRLINGGVGLIFKGSGFYLTDYKRASSSPASDGSSKKESEKETSTTSKEKA